ncbi:hypothetical protein DFR24_3496 [Panacagrimonas perspica]|uniref:BRCT domain-containing protein n=1 Tax=Panacagrimonas perspica TaxID=381431 RepID=A0A4R7P0V0_9GAMM|nr:BRCT domain-containing protein [Panacagrimonas perspica]TDU26470.1 hypothetical protein DFR24_3496 [Panacagrimonas perspica]THD02089.1 NAD-dependent DNA ligase [Panacagrimonas perspica]
MHVDHQSYLHFSGPRQLERSVNSLVGLIEGISIDQSINSKELGFLSQWLEEHRPLSHLHPFNELVPAVATAIGDGALTAEEKDDLQWLCERLLSSEFSDFTAAGIQRLHAVLGGIAADTRIDEAELRGLSLWLDEHDYLKSCWPYDEVESVVTQVMRDGRIDADEHRMLTQFFSEFTAKLDDRTITAPLITDGQKISGLCAVCPDISVEDRTFAFTGASSRYTRKDFSALISQRGGRILPGVSAKLDYLIIGAEGNPCWMYACYGRKVEKAVQLRKQGIKLLLVHENDFHDALS